MPHSNTMTMPHQHRRHPQHRRSRHHNQLQHRHSYDSSNSIPPAPLMMHVSSSGPKNVYTVATPASTVARGGGGVITARTANPAVAASFVPDEVAHIDHVVNNDPNGNYMRYERGKRDANNNGSGGDYVVRHVSMIRVNEGGGGSSAKNALKREGTFTKADVTEVDEAKDVWRVTQVIAPGKEDNKKGRVKKQRAGIRVKKIL